MDDNLAIFLVIMVSIVAAVMLSLATTWIRARHRMLTHTGADETILRLTQENARLETEVDRLAARTAVLERTAPDPAGRTAREIEALR